MPICTINTLLRNETGGYAFWFVSRSKSIKNYIPCLLHPKRLGIAPSLGKKSRWHPQFLYWNSHSSAVWSVKWDIASLRATGTEICHWASAVIGNCHSASVGCLCKEVMISLSFSMSCTNDRPIYKKKAIRKPVPGKVYTTNLRLRFLVALSSSIPLCCCFAWIFPKQD